EPPLWMAGAGSDWPLFAALARASRHLDSEAARQAAQTVSAIPPESLPARRQRHHRLLPGRAALTCGCTNRRMRTGASLAPPPWT
ncbi:MAG: hypothetical protein ACE5G8_11790, partial [Anaerolineae bacterium]